MSRIFWDTNLYIYLIEGKTSMAQQVTALRKKMRARGDQLLTSTLTLGEVLVKPLQMGDLKLAIVYQEELTLSSVLVPFDAKAAGTYARLRSDLALRAPDAIQLACAATAGVDLFITNDIRLYSKQIPGIQFIVPLDRVPI
jgi:predicted nucleic acid-binding protein